MRIAIVDPSLFTLPYDGALARGLSNIGHQPTLHGRAMRAEDGAAQEVRLEEDFYRVAGSRLGTALPSPLRLAVKGLDHIWSMRRLLAKVRRERPDVIHFQWLPLPLIDRMLLGQFRKIAPLVLTVHDTNPFNGDPSAALQGRGLAQCLELFDRLVVHTAQGRDRMLAMGASHERVVVLPHGMLVDPVPSAPDPMQASLTFLLFGKIKPYKGTDLLIEAFAALPEALQRQARLRIVGKPYMDIAPLQAMAAPLGNAVQFEAGFVADDAITELFGAGTVAVFPYREIEASGVMFLAMAHGRPIIASRLGSFAELIEDGVHGHVLPPGNVPALTAAMAHMITDRVFAAACAAAVRDLADSVPDWNAIAERTVATYRAAGATAGAAETRLTGAVARA